MPPPNTTSGTATVISSLPYSISQDQHDAGTTYEGWWKWTATFTGVIGALGYGDQVTYTPTVLVYKHPDVVTNYLSITGFNVPIIVPVDEGETYYLRYVPNAGNPTPAILAVEVYAAPTIEAESGMIVVNDDGFQRGAILSIDADNTVLQYRVMPPGEAGDVLPGLNVMAFEDIIDDDIKLLDANFSEIASVAVNSQTFRGSIRATPSLDRFYALSKTPNPDQVVAIETDGSISNTYTITGTNDIGAIAVASDGDTLYYWRSADTQKVRRWSLSGAAALSDLCDEGAGGSVADIIVLADDTIIISFMNFLANQHVSRYDASGTLLNTYDFSGEPDRNFPNASFWRIARGLDDPDTFWYWSKHDVSNPSSNGGYSKFRQVRVSDGAILVTRTFIEYETGSYQGDSTDYPFVRFGNSFSCPFFLLPFSVEGSPAGGSGSGSGSDGSPSLEVGVIGPIVWIEWPRRVP